VEQILTSLEPSKVTAAFDLNLRDFLVKFGELPGTKVATSPELTWLATGLQSPILNAVLLTNLAPESVSEAILEVQAHFKSRRVTMCWCTGPHTRPPELSKYLAAQGFSFAMASPGMAVNLQKIDENVSTPKDLEIVRVEDARILQKWSYVNQVGYNSSNEVGQAYADLMLRLGFDQPAVRYYLALLKGEPVASALICLSAGIAGVYNVVTLPAARGQGIGSKIVLTTLQEARAAGYRVAALQSSEIGFNIYRQLGFEQFCSYERYYWTPPLD
jgi:GNAT superfamily N-acetyltransferase